MADKTCTCVTLHGIPLTLRLNFPFHPSAGGADYFVLHGNAALEDGSGRHAEISVHMSQVVREALSAVDESAALAPTINAIRKTVDMRDIEFLQSNKRQPVHLSSRMYNAVQMEFTFHAADDAQLETVLKDRLYWSAKLGAEMVAVADPVEMQYLAATRDRMLAAARKLAAAGLCTLEGETAIASPALMSESGSFEARRKKAVEEIEAKHAFERL